MRLTFLLFSLLIISCLSKEKKAEVEVQTGTPLNKGVTERKELIKERLMFEEEQEALRTRLLKLRTNENLKSSILQELYIRRLVNQKNDSIGFVLPFNIHGFDCSAPDCYTTEIEFSILEKKPIEFPEKINFTLKEYGCEIETEVKEGGIFELVEQAPAYVNYYSEKQKSNLIIIANSRKLYYFTDQKQNVIKVDSVAKVFEAYNENDIQETAPYQSTTMTTNNYALFLEKE